MRAKKCWKAFYRRYGTTIDGYRPLYSDNFYFDYKRETNIYDAYRFHKDIAGRYEGKEYPPDTTCKSNSLWHRLDKDLAYGMKPLLQGLIKLGYTGYSKDLTDSLILGHVTIGMSDGGHKYWAKWNFLKSTLTFNRTRTRGDNKVFKLNPNLTISRYIQQIDKLFSNQLLSTGYFGEQRSINEVYLYELLEYYRRERIKNKSYNEGYNPWYNGEMIENHLLRRLRKKCNIDLVNKGHIEEDFSQLKHQRYKTLTKVNTSAKYITYADLEAEASCRGEELDDTNLEEIFYDIVDDR